MDKKLKKSADRMIGGVCGGVAEYFDVDPTIVRVAYACLTVFSAGFPGVVLYLILCLIMPRNDQNYIK
ncbi:MAG: PspC domain-containing protein [Bacteroidales bacterium]|nr:PspC domain-containing protein [Bacteroidales bacterium]